MSSKLNVTLHFYIYIFIYIKENTKSLKVLVKVFSVFNMINKLNTDQALIQIKRSENVQHIDNVQPSQTDDSSL